MEVTLNIPDELATRLRPFEDRLPEILERGIREWSAPGQEEFEGMTDVLEVLARLPSPEEVLALRPSAALQERIDVLLNKNRFEGLSPEEQREWQQYEYLEHLVRLAKAQATLRRWGLRA